MRQVAYGPPGTGKTTHIKEAVAALISEGGVSPAKTYLLSFSKAGAAELAERIKQQVNVGTIHSLCYRLVGLNRGRVIDNRKLVDYAEYSGIEIKLDRIKEDGSTEELTDGERAYAIYGLARARCENPHDTYMRVKDPPQNAVWFRYYCESYDKWKNTYGFVDFNDMLILGEKLFREECDLEIDLLVIDEAQDLSEQQWRVVYLLAQRAKHFIVAGDDDQAIFAWAGANPEGMRLFSQAFNAEEKVLGRSYRLPPEIKRAAETLILRVQNRVDKPFTASDKEGRITTAPDVVQACDSRETLILYRNHSIRQEFERDLIDAGIPYWNLNGRAAPLRSVLAELVRQMETVPSLAFLDRSISWALDKFFRANDIRRYEDGHINLLEFVNTARWDADQLYYLTGLMKANGSMKAVYPNVKISTIHGSKGREADHVILVNSTTSNSLEGWENDKENEIRVWYVGMTRAKSELTIVEYENPVDLI